MLPGVEQLVHKLRGDGHYPLVALDAWELAAIQRFPPSSIHELSSSLEMRRGPRGRGPELSREQVGSWIRRALDERLVVMEPSADPERPRWRVTEQGQERLRETRAIGRRLGALVGWVLRAPSLWAHAVARLDLEETVDSSETPPPRRVGMRPITRAPGDAETSAEQARANLKQVDHIVVLMMENRSFDHMLGYLTLDGQAEVDGVDLARSNPWDGSSHHPKYLLSTAFPKSMDPPHGTDSIKEQINGGAMDGFIESFATRNQIADEPERVMGYYSHRELPVYDHLAHNFTICDRWYSSVPSATWPNRLFSLAGTCDPDREGLLGEVRDGEILFDFPSFVGLLDPEKAKKPEDLWRWYSWDPGTLRLADSRYRSPDDGFHHKHFRRVAQHAFDPEPPQVNGEPKIEPGSGLLEDAANGDLPRVAWIDPNFVDLSILDANSNDDHPPSDIRAGQELVMMILRALTESPCWERTMLVVTYDEHGGFYDHVAPPRPPEDDPIFRTYGVRVPSFVVSPFVEPATVSHTTFDHASIVRTILERFGVEGAVERMAAEGAPRVALAEHLGRLLTRTPAAGEPRPDFTLPLAALESWRHGRAKRRSAAAKEIGERSRSEAEWKPEPITGFPADFLHGARRLREDGLPAGHP